MIVADARRLPLVDSTVALVCTNPPYPGNGVWESGYWQSLMEAEAECRRVLTEDGWLLELVPLGEVEWWMQLDKAGAIEGAWPGRSVMPDLPARRGWKTLPRDVVEEMVGEFSKPGDVVLDPFGGSGLVASVANDLGRIGLSMDISFTQAQLARWRCAQS